MRIAKSKWSVVVLGGVLIIIAAVLGTILSGQMRDRSQVDSELAAAEESLSELEGAEALSQSDVGQRVSAVLAERDSARAYLSQPTDTIVANEALFGLARQTGVIVNGISASSTLEEALGEIECSVLPMSVAVEGTVANILEFLMHLNTDLTNGVIETADVIAPRAAQEMPTASVKLAIYQYEGE
jgi:hypothetical protein